MICSGQGRFGPTLAGALASAHCAGGAPRAVHSSTNVHRTFNESTPYHTIPFHGLLVAEKRSRGNLATTKKILDDGEVEGELLPGEVGGRSAQEHRAAGVAEEHGLLEADHRVRRRTGRGHTVVRVPTLPPPDRDEPTHMQYVDKDVDVHVVMRICGSALRTHTKSMVQLLAIQFQLPEWRTLTVSRTHTKWNWKVFARARQRCAATLFLIQRQTMAQAQDSQRRRSSGH